MKSHRETCAGSSPAGVVFFIKLKNELEGLDRKTIKLYLLESIEYFYYSKNKKERKKEKG